MFHLTPRLEGGLLIDLGRLCSNEALSRHPTIIRCEIRYQRSLLWVCSGPACEISITAPDFHLFGVLHVGGIPGLRGIKAFWVYTILPD